MIHTLIGSYLIWQNIKMLFFFQKNTNKLVEFAYAHLKEEKNEVKLRSFFYVREPT